MKTNFVLPQTLDFLANFGIDSSFILKRELPSFENAINLVVADVSQSGREHELVLEAANAWQAMKKAAHAESISLIIVSAFRSFSRQAEIVTHSIENTDDIESIFKLSAPPGYSEHHSGKAIDIGTMGCKPLSQEFAQTTAYDWLMENAKEFGFRLTYPVNNKYGFQFEPWHWFYIGKPVIRKITISDVNHLQALGIQTFTETFSDSNSKDDLENYFSEKFNLTQLTRELTNPNSAFYFVELDGQSVGYLKTNTKSAQTDNTLMDALEIERIYILKEFQGRKLGKLLFHKALEITQQANLKRIWLGVWEHNVQAIGFYQRQGFTKFAEHPFVVGDKVDNDWLMKLELTDKVSGRM